MRAVLLLLADGHPNDYRDVLLFKEESKKTSRTRTRRGVR